MPAELSAKENFYLGLLDELQPGWRTGEDIIQKTKEQMRLRIYIKNQDMMESVGCVSLRVIKDRITAVKKKLGIPSKKRPAAAPLSPPGGEGSFFTGRLADIYIGLPPAVRQKLDASGLPLTEKETILDRFGNVEISDEGKIIDIRSAMARAHDRAETAARKAHNRKLRNLEQQQSDLAQEREEMINRLFVRLAHEMKCMDIASLKHSFEYLLVALNSGDVKAIMDAVSALDADKEPILPVLSPFPTSPANESLISPN